MPWSTMRTRAQTDTSAGLKLKLSKGDAKAVQGDGGWNTPDMVMK